MSTRFMKGSRGFTLIELLVVIAIIGVLASIVLASLNQARNKGADAAIKADLAGIRAQAELTYDSNNCYSDGIAAASGCAAAAFAAATCPAGAAAGDDTVFNEPNVQKQIADAAAKSGGAASCVSSANQAGYAISVPLKSTPTTSWCIDSGGASKLVTPAGGDLGFAAAACK